MEYIESYGIHSEFMPSVVLMTFIEMRLGCMMGNQMLRKFISLDSPLSHPNKV